MVKVKGSLSSEVPHLAGQGSGDDNPAGILWFGGEVTAGMRNPIPPQFSTLDVGDLKDSPGFPRVTLTLPGLPNGR